jgi:O-antigen biosynthesis protein
MINNEVRSKKLLVIAPTVPRYDQNAGDLQLISLLKIVRSQFKVDYLAWRIDESDNKYKDELISLGITVGLHDELHNLLKKNRYFAVWFEFYFVARSYLPIVKFLCPQALTIIDTVDVHFARAFSKFDITHDADDLKFAEDTRCKEIEIYRQADVVVTVTQDDLELIKTELPAQELRVIPIIHEIKPKTCVYTTLNELIFVGGFKHDPNVDAVLHFVNNIFPEIKKRCKDVKLKIVGSNPPECIKSLGSREDIEVTGFVPEVSSHLYSSFISIAPLRYGAGMKGKVGEAMAHGVPVVATPIGAQGMGLEHRQNIMIAESDDDFVAHVLELIQDDVLYENISRNSLQFIKDTYSVDAVAGNILDIFINSEKLKKIHVGFFGRLVSAIKYRRNTESL